MRMLSILTALALMFLTTVRRVALQRRREKENRSMRDHLYRISESSQ
jgi:hypothetical protein